MPLHILLILVVGGIAGLALAMHLLGLSQTPYLTERSAREGWRRHRPDDTILHIDLTKDGHAARITTDAGRGILWQMGADTCARVLRGDESVHTGRTGLTLHLNDYSAPKIHLRLSADEKEHWANWITST